MINTFRIIGFLEGISYILLLGVGVPYKYLLHNDSWVKALGMPHGLLFMAYIFLAYMVKTKMKWNNSSFITVLLASIIPFGTFYVDKKYLANREAIS